MDHQFLRTYNQTHYQEEHSDPIDQETVDLYKLTEPTDLQDINVDDAWNTFTSELAEKQTPTRSIDWRPLLKIAAVLVVAFGIGLFTYDSLQTNTENTQIAMVQVKTDLERKSVQLPDGTMVWMNEGSQLAYPETFGEARKIQFTGEGYFEVAKANTTFTIQTPQTQVEVLGTAFNLNTTNRSYTKVTVTEGIVSFSAEDIKSKILAGEEGIYTKASKSISLNQNPDVNSMSWKTGHFVFDNTELDKVINYLNGYYKQDIEIDQKMSSCKVTGTFTKLPLKEVLEEISIILSAEVINKGETFTISGEGC